MRRGSSPTCTANIIKTKQPAYAGWVLAGILGEGAQRDRSLFLLADDVNNHRQATHIWTSKQSQEYSPSYGLDGWCILTACGLSTAHIIIEIPKLGDGSLGCSDSQANTKRVSSTERVVLQPPLLHRRPDIRWKSASYNEQPHRVRVAD